MASCRCSNTPFFAPVRTLLVLAALLLGAAPGAFAQDGYFAQWFERSDNSTWWHGGLLDGKHVTYVTPGLILGRFHLGGRVNIALGAGVQIATTEYHPYAHAYVSTVRLPF